MPWRIAGILVAVGIAIGAMLTSALVCKKTMPAYTPMYVPTKTPVLQLPTTVYLPGKIIHDTLTHKEIRTPDTVVRYISHPVLMPEINSAYTSQPATSQGEYRITPPFPSSVLPAFTLLGPRHILTMNAVLGTGLFSRELLAGIVTKFEMGNITASLETIYLSGLHCIVSVMYNFWNIL